jgi:hypothetical protein
LKAKEGDDPEANMQKLINKCQRIMEAIYSTAHMIPTYVVPIAVAARVLCPFR